jgi:hypothetical protein
MSGFIAVAFAGLLMQQAAPHPSTQTLYQAPAIRPFEPPSDFGRETAQGDAEGDVHRRPLEAPVAVGTYARSYEFTPTDGEVAYEQGVASAEIRADQIAGPLDGRWRVADEQGRVLFGLVLADPATGLTEGGWRGASGSGAAAFDGQALSLENLGAMTLEPAGEGWRGTLRAGGRTRPVTLTRPA